MSKRQVVFLLSAAAAVADWPGLGPAQLTGDMRLPPPADAGLHRQRKLLPVRRRPDPAPAGPEPDVRWPVGASGWPEIPFYLVQDAGPGVVEAWQHGRRHWEAHTCLRFRELTWVSDANCSRQSREPVVCVQGASDGCYSAVGRQRLPSPLGPDWTRPQVLNLDPEICKQTSVIHEIGHVVGLVHEMSRSAARDHLQINFRHMQLSRQLWAQSQACRTAPAGVPYDYLSIMHYGTFAGSRDGQAVFVTRDPLRQHLVDHNDDVRFVAGLPALSHLDRYAVNSEYECPRLWAAAHCGGRLAACAHLGYMGADCRCVCTPGRGGDRCETETGPRWPPPACLRRLSGPAEFPLSAAGLTLRHEGRPETCTVLVRGPTGSLARVTVSARRYVRRALAGEPFSRLASEPCGLGLSVLLLPGDAADGRAECVDSFVVSGGELRLRAPAGSATLHVRLHQVSSALLPALSQVRVRVDFAPDPAAALRVLTLNRTARLLQVLRQSSGRLPDLLQTEPAPSDAPDSGSGRHTRTSGTVVSVMAVVIVWVR